jgi:hypothetical protein
VPLHTAKFRIGSSILCKSSPRNASNDLTKLFPGRRTGRNRISPVKEQRTTKFWPCLNLSLMRISRGITTRPLVERVAVISINSTFLKSVKRWFFLSRVLTE